MDWELKALSWDFTDIAAEDDHDPRLAALVGSNSLSPNNIRGDFSVDLKLGRLGGVADDKGKVQKGPFIALSPSGSSKRARATRATQSVSCLVDSCMVDLSGCKEYHRRHRVCERHSKSPVASIRGKEHRFCQQCSRSYFARAATIREVSGRVLNSDSFESSSIHQVSCLICRFQSLAEFDEEKRSCRKRLDGHNRRRRKPQPEAFYMNNGSFLSNHQGARLLHFSCPEAYERRPGIPRHHPFSHYLATSLATTNNGADKCFPFLLANYPETSNNHQPQAVPQVTIHSRLAHSSASININTHRAHSLLSLPRPISPSVQFESRCTEARMVSMYPDDLLEKGASQVLPFSWK